MRPAILAGALLLAYGLFFVIDPVRDFFQLTLLSWPDVIVTALLTAAWAALVLMFWRIRLYDRVMGVVHAARGRKDAQPAA